MAKRRTKKEIKEAELIEAQNNTKVTKEVTKATEDIAEVNEIVKDVVVAEKVNKDINEPIVEVFDTEYTIEDDVNKAMEAIQPKNVLLASVVLNKFKQIHEGPYDHQSVLALIRTAIKNK